MSFRRVRCRRHRWEMWWRQYWSVADRRQPWRWTRHPRAALRRPPPARLVTRRPRWTPATAAAASPPARRSRSSTSSPRRRHRGRQRPALEPRADRRSPLRRCRPPCRRRPAGSASIVPLPLLLLQASGTVRQSFRRVRRPRRACTAPVSCSTCLRSFACEANGPTDRADGKCTTYCFRLLFNAVATSKTRLRLDGRSTACQMSLSSQWRNPLAAVTLTYLFI